MTTAPLHTGIPSNGRGDAGGHERRPPAASVVTTVYNRASILGRAMHSVLDQSFTDFEYIIVDDGSTDGSADVAEAIDDPRIRVIRSPHHGRASALNTAFAACTAEFILIQDSDDIALPGRFEKQIAFLRGHPDVGMVGSWLLMAGDNGTARRQYILPSQHDRIFDLMLVTSAVSFGASAIRRQCAVVTGPFNEALVAAEDYEFQLRLLDHCRFANIPEVLQEVRLLDDSQSIVRSQEQRQWTRDLALAFINRNAAGVPPLFSEPARHRCIGRVQYYYGDIRTARSALIQSLRMQPWSLETWRYLLPCLLGETVLAAFRTTPRLRRPILRLKRLPLFRRYFLP
ncbi:MAG: glycosyltransferase [Bacteroidetes bacterium]|nr:glycosyltransferase [Bacteroidota bacterium]